MRILQLTSHLDPGGITTSVLDVAEGLAGRGHQVTVAAGPAARAARLERAGVAYWPMPLKTSAEFSLPVWRAAGDLRRRLRAQPVDLVHAHTRVAQVIADGLWRRLRIPYVTTWHGFYRRRLGRRLLPATGLLTIAISPPVAEDLARQFRVPVDRIRLIPHGIDTARFAAADRSAVSALRQRLQLPETGRVVGTVARLVADKGIDQLLFAFELLARTGDDVRLVIVGDGPDERRLKQLAAERGIAPRVVFAGGLPGTNDALHLMDVFVFLPAVREGFGLALIEAMAAGRAVVGVRRGGGGAWLLESSQAGVLVEPEQPEALAAAILRLLQDRTEAARLGDAAQRAARERYDRGRMIDDVERVYRECVQQFGATVTIP